MPSVFTQPGHHRRAGFLLAVCAAAVLGACGGGGSDGSAAPGATGAADGGGAVTTATTATTSTTIALDLAPLPDAVATQLVEPMFHVAPMILEAPDDADSDDSSASARTRAQTRQIEADLEGTSSRRLTLPAMKAMARQRGLARGAAPAAPGIPADGAVAPLAASGTVTTYSPAQIRAAYSLPALPASGSAMTAAQAAQLGAGQTIYVVNARHDPNVAAELAAFNQKFGLPACTTRTIAVGTALPLAAPAAGSGCELAIAYNTAAGTLSATAPGFDAGWATEIALDVQWAHATAPLARIVLIEAADASVNNLLGGIKLANAMGPGVVSMSFGGAEGSWTASVDAAFAAPGMSYLAATGDSGAAVAWPSVSQNVLAVGGTTLNYSGSGQRTETGWAGTGGGISQYVAQPAYQTSAVPGLGTPGRRAVADVAFNSNPKSGQYVALMTPGSTAVNWVSAGGTSLATPQWAGILAIANAQRKLAAKPMLGLPHALLYGQIATVPGTYASAFADIVSGSDGNCALCVAKSGYDTLSGLGSPNVTNLLTVLAGTTGSSAAPAPAAPAPVAPVVAAGTASGKAGVALGFTAGAVAPNPVAYSLTGTPAGMAINSAGAVSWPAPVAGTYAVTVVARDGKTGLSGSAVWTVRIASSGPVITASSFAGVVGKPPTATISIADPGATSLSISLSGVPAGMSFTASGTTLTANWAKPVAGSFSLKVSVTDSANLSAQATLPVTIALK